MAAKVPPRFRDLLQDESRALAILATSMDDGSPQATPIWFDTEGDLIRVNTARGRVKDRNMRERPAVALVIVDPDDWYRYVQLRGTVVEETTEGAAEHLVDLAEKYTGSRDYRSPTAAPRVIYKVRIDSVDAVEE